MQVILLERVEKLGQMGDVVNVKDGFARNFLLPQKKALRATKDNVASFQTRRQHLEATNLEQRKEAEGVAAKMQNLSVTILRQASEGGQLYGSVSARDIAEAISAAGFTVVRRQVILQTTVKTMGIVTVPVALHPEVSVNVKVNVARSRDEAEAQAAGITITAAASDATKAAEEFFESAELAERADLKPTEAAQTPTEPAAPAPAKAKSGKKKADKAK
ncbi:MAG: 50S ribosomal protein L9 [Alphaproteobacteria bacterium]|nr:50S ribosomal protein L9 [Alphaproteobacteria bacterium]